MKEKTDIIYLTDRVYLSRGASLASVITPRFEIGRRAAQMLLNKIKNNDLNHNTIDLGYQIYHGSTL